MTNFNIYDDSGERKEKNMHNMSHKNIFPYNMGNIVPFMFEDLVPGDEVDLNLNLIANFSPLVTRQMSDVVLNMRLFFVPKRLLYRQFNQFYMRPADGVLPNDELPHINISAGDFPDFYNRYSAIYRHFGLSDINNNGLSVINNAPSKINLLPFRAYNQIFYYYYMPMDLIELGIDGQKYREYMTENDLDSYANLAAFEAGEGRFLKNKDTTGEVQGYYQAFNYGDFYSQVKPDFNVSNISIGTTMNDFRVGKSMQKFFDTLLGVKGRFNKYSRMLFGTAPKVEYDRPIYIGGKSSTALIGDIHATTEATGQPLGAYAGKGSGFLKENNKFTAHEFGYLVGMVDITPKIQYGKVEHERISGIDWMDIYRPEFESAFIHEVKEKHAYRNYLDVSANPESTWGYSIPYNQYRFPRSMSFGELTGSLSYWNVLQDDLLDIVKKGVGKITDYAIGTPDETDYWYEITKDLFAVPTEPQVFIEAFNGISKRSVIKHEIASILSQ